MSSAGKTIFDLRKEITKLKQLLKYNFCRSIDRYRHPPCLLTLPSFSLKNTHAPLKFTTESMKFYDWKCLRFMNTCSFFSPYTSLEDIISWHSNMISCPWKHIIDISSHLHHLDSATELVVTPRVDRTDSDSWKLIRITSSQGGVTVESFMTKKKVRTS